MFVLQEHDQGAHSIGVAKKHKRDVVPEAVAVFTSPCGEEDCPDPAAFACKVCQAEYCEVRPWARPAFALFFFLLTKNFFSDLVTLIHEEFVVVTPIYSPLLYIVRYFNARS